METVKVVIKLSKEVYDTIIKDIEQENWYDENAPIDKTMRAIANGTVLPKGHGDLKDVDKLIKESSVDMWTDYGYESMVTVEAIDDAPTVIEADKEETNAND